MRALCCHQDIASTGAFTVAMLGEFDATLDAHGGHGYSAVAARSRADWPGALSGPGRWPARHRHWLFLTTPCTARWAWNDARLQTLYHFTVGLPVVDARVETTPPYPDADLTERP